MKLRLVTEATEVKKDFTEWQGLVILRINNMRVRTSPQKSRPTDKANMCGTAEVENHM